MKKITIIAIALCATLVASAEITDQLWTSLFNDAPALTGLETGGEGVGWFVQIWDATDSVQVYGNTTPSEWGFWVGAGYDIEVFNFTATETHDVALRLYNAGSIAGASMFVESAAFGLSDIEGAPAADAFNVDFDFSTSSWEAVPEPATAMLLALGGGLAWLVRMKNIGY